MNRQRHNRLVTRALQNRLDRQLLIVFHRAHEQFLMFRYLTDRQRMNSIGIYYATDFDDIVRSHACNSTFIGKVEGCIHRLAALQSLNDIEGNASITSPAAASNCLGADASAF